MTTLQVDNMTCSRCASTISRAISTVDRGARTNINIAEKLVRVTSIAPTAELLLAIEEAGYSAKEVQLEPSPPVQTKAGGGCCCRRRIAAADDADQTTTTAAGSRCA